MDKKRLDKRLRIQVLQESEEGWVWSYVLDNKLRRPSEMATQAIKAFFMPYALEENDDRYDNSENLKRVARDAIYALEAQIERIEKDFFSASNEASLPSATRQPRRKKSNRVSDSALKDAASSPDSNTSNTKFEPNELSESDFSDMPQVREFIKLPTELEA